FLLDALEGLASLMKTHEVSFVEDTEKPGENQFTPVLRVALDPFVKLAQSSAEDLQDETARTIYKTNILLTTRTTISAYPFASATHLQRLSTSISTIRIDLLEIQHRYLLSSSGLQVLLEALEPYSPSTSTSQTKIHQRQPSTNLVSI